MANQTAYLDDTLRWGLDWMLKAHPNPRTLYVLVSSGQFRRPIISPAELCFSDRTRHLLGWRPQHSLATQAIPD